MSTKVETGGEGGPSINPTANQICKVKNRYGAASSNSEALQKKNNLKAGARIYTKEGVLLESGLSPLPPHSDIEINLPKLPLPKNCIKPSGSDEIGSSSEVKITYASP